MLKRLMIISGLLLLSACSKLSMDTYKQLKVGMSYDEVTGIIGGPDSCSEKLGTRNCIWGDAEGSHIKASFVKESAVLFSHRDLK